MGSPLANDITYVFTIEFDFRPGAEVCAVSDASLSPRRIASTSYVKTPRIKVVAPPVRRYPVTIGGTALSSLITFLLNMFVVQRARHERGDPLDTELRVAPVNIPSCSVKLRPSESAWSRLCSRRSILPPCTWRSSLSCLCSLRETRQES